MTDDIEVARYALRTFKVEKGTLRSPNRVGSHWRNGTCEAKCLRFDYLALAMHDAPHEGCTCGIYGTLDLAALTWQFPEESRDLITVIAAEGTTIIGDTGLRTAAARVVAYWSPRRRIKKICKRHLGGAEGFDSLVEMLAAYKLPSAPPPPPPCCDYKRSHPDAHFHAHTLLGVLTAPTAVGLAQLYAETVGGKSTHGSLYCQGECVGGPIEIPLLSMHDSYTGRRWTPAAMLSWATTTFDVPPLSGEIILELHATPDGPAVERVSLGFWAFPDSAQIGVTVTYTVA